MTTFTMDNTEGYSVAELTELNRRFAEAMAGVDVDDPHYLDIEKSVAERLLSE